jgi:transposase
MPQNKKYDDEFRMKCFDLYCEGMTSKQIAKILGVSSAAIRRLKNKKFPQDWEKGRAERVTKKVDFVQKYAVSSLEEMLARHQRMFAEISEKTAKLLCQRATNGELEDRIMVDTFFKAMEEERKLYVPLLLLYAPNFFQIQLVRALQEALGEDKFLSILRQNLIIDPTGRLLPHP